MSEPFIVPDWPAPGYLRAVSTTRAGGVSTGPYASLNLGTRCGDEPHRVAANRERLSRALGLPQRWHWLNQVHGVRVVDAVDLNGDDTDADAVFASEPGAVCAIRTADCLPVLLCCRDRPRVAAAHAGWRGLCAGVIEATVGAMGVPPSRLLAWLGPGISAAYYEVGDEVRSKFVGVERAAAHAFTATRPGHWLADLGLLARQRLSRLGVTAVFAANACTFADRERFYSYRRDGVTGRMASLIWIDPAL